MDVDVADEILCPCRRVTRRTVEQAARTSPSFEDLCRATGAGVTCFGCALEVEEILGNVRPEAVAWAHTPTVPLAKSLLGIYRRACLAMQKVPYALYRQAGWYVNRPALHTRLVTCHLPIPTARGYLTEPHLVQVLVFDADGREIASVTRRLEPSGTLALEIRDLLGDRDAHGLILWRFIQPQLGSGRSYLQWYSDVSITSTHEKIWSKGEGYFAIPKIPVDPDLDTHWITVNPRTQAYSAEFLLSDNGREVARRAMTLGPRCAQFTAVDDLFPGFRDKGPNLTLHLSVNNARIFCYYLVHNRARDTWQGQHL